MTEAGTSGSFPALRRGTWAIGVGCLLISAALGTYSVLAGRPDCAGLYVCRRVLDRTILLGVTSIMTAVAAAILVVIAMRIGRRGVSVVRVVLILGACILVAAYWKTQFSSLRADLAAQMALTPSMWTASSALWFAVAGLVCVAVGTQSK
ncbi:hypothetical protein [Mycolicibacterium fluoranthenivorans]|uniref:Uncharacterized protein n=1 Tax=Mycolicibacterium fluoranthenivorans TaxID=258505 RepID=A0A1G4WEZ3_9MYCO|nr:hypothetical protein [Mycolicibacterium fluoranthenivorans]SCX21631.1 hypothetical protein SAMN02799620_03043 [Mycolicibacterium fluoranthenivorans]